MKSNRKIILANAPLLLLALVLTVSGCRKAPAPTPQSEPMTFSSSVLTQPHTKYTGGKEFHSGDQISLYAFAWTTETQPEFTDPELAHINNAVYTRDDDYFVYAGAGSVGFPANGTKLDFYAIYPYSAAVFTDPTKYEIETPTDQSSSEKQLPGDLLIAKKGEVAPQLQPIHLVFQHAMSKLQVAVCKNADYPADIDIADIRFKVGTKATVNLQTQEALLSKPATTVYVQPTNEKDADTDTLRGTAILAPQVIVNTYPCVEVQMSNNKIHYFTFPADFDLAGNTITKLRLSLSYGSANAVQVSAVITNWGSGAVISAENVTQQSENTFSCTVTKTEDQTTASQAAFAKITTQIASEGQRTFTVPATYNADTKQWLFEFRGVGNRPNTYPFTVKSVDILKTDYSVLATIDNVNKVVTQPDPVSLTYPVTTLDYTTQPANCYATQPGVNILFDARKKAVSVNGPATNVVQSDVPSADINPETVSVVWQTAANHGTTGGAANMIIKNLEFDDQTAICTITPHATATGNALVAAYAADGTTILWSWHIWVTKGRVQATSPTAFNDGRNFMDRNLGALAATTVQPAAADAFKYFGLLWQWGRKEPFTGQGLGETANVYTKIYKADATPYADALGGFTYNNGAATTMMDCIKNPTTHYYGGNDGNVITGNPNTWSDGPTSKSIYDPCPYGYRVPIGGSWAGFPAQTWTAGTINEGQSWQSTWWPAAGYRNRNDAALVNSTYSAHYWSLSRHSSIAYYSHCLYFTCAGNVNPIDISSRSQGLSLRCVQE